MPLDITKKKKKIRGAIQKNPVKTTGTEILTQLLQRINRFNAWDKARTRFWWHFGGTATHLKKIKNLNTILSAFGSEIYL